MDISTAIECINTHPDLSASERRGSIEVRVYGRPAGTVTQDDLDALGHSATGWGKNLRKGALKVWETLTTQ